MSAPTQSEEKPILALADWLRMAHSLLDGKTKELSIQCQLPEPQQQISEKTTCTMGS